MGTFRVRRPTGKLCAETRTRAQANREIKWQLASGFHGPFTIECGEPNERLYRTQWGDVLGTQRAGYKWCAAKTLEFLKRYIRGECVNFLADYFSTNISVVCAKARQLGFNKRIDDPRTFEQHRGRWTVREEELINFMYDDLTSVARITELHPRSPSAVKSRLRDTAEELSTRHSAGRFIVKGRRGIAPVADP